MSVYFLCLFINVWWFPTWVHLHMLWISPPPPFSPPTLSLTVKFQTKPHQWRCKGYKHCSRAKRCKSSARRFLFYLQLYNFFFSILDYVYPFPCFKLIVEYKRVYYLKACPIPYPTVIILFFCFNFEIRYTGLKKITP